jgi:hypothetical protein
LVLWVRRLLAVGTMSSVAGVLAWSAYLVWRPPCRDGSARLIDLTGLVIGVLALALVVQSIAWWRWRSAPTSDVSAVLAVLGLLALLPTLLLTLYGVYVVVTTLGRDYDRCWTAF